MQHHRRRRQLDSVKDLLNSFQRRQHRATLERTSPSQQPVTGTRYDDIYGSPTGGKIDGNYKQQASNYSRDCNVTNQLAIQSVYCRPCRSCDV